MAIEVFNRNECKFIVDGEIYEKLNKRLQNIWTRMLTAGMMISILLVTFIMIQKMIIL